MPPVFVGESLKAFDDYVLAFAKCMAPEDKVVETLVYRFAIETWRQMSLMRFQTEAVRRRDQTRAKFDREHAENYEQRRGAYKLGKELIKDIKEENDPEFTALVMHETPYDTLKYAASATSEAEHAIAFEKALEVYQDIDFLISQSVKRANSILQQIEFYRLALAERLRNKHQTTIEELANKGSNKRVGPQLIPDQEQHS